AFGPSAPTVASTSVGDVVVYAGGDGNLYYAVKPSPSTAFTLSAQAGSIAGLANTISPTPIVDAAGNLEVFYVRDSDRVVCRTTLALPAQTWSSEEVVHASAITDRSPAASLSPAGDLYVSWHAFNSASIFFTKGTTTFGAPLPVATPASASNGPVMTSSTESTVDSEVLYSSGGKLFHMRLAGTTVTGGEVPGLTSVTDVAATTVP
ncbi:MAG TPA: hypothetical protein VL400_13200, partial [Polyangiaceae bacterium]|nr:hypothetical protein [Polyangiaceae bacterium]